MDHEDRAGTSGDHSHSLIRKLLDEIDAVVTAARWNGSFEAHHDRDLENFLERLRTVFEKHTEYEEEGLFDRIRSELDDRGREHLEVIIEQHRTVEEHLETVEARFEALELGASGDARSLRRLEDAVETLQEAWSEHDDAESTLFERIDEDHSG